MVDRAQSDWLDVVVVPDSIANRIRGEVDYSEKKMDLGGFREEWNQRFKFKFVKYDDLTKQERLEGYRSLLVSRCGCYGFGGGGIHKGLLSAISHSLGTG